MLLYLVRHGIAVARDDPRCPPDSDRPLTGEGRRRTRAVARGLETLGAAPALFLASPYVRAAETAALLRSALAADAEMRSLDSLVPDGDPAGLFVELRRTDAEQVMCVGHAPHLDRALAAAVGTERWAVTRLKKAGVACLELDPRTPAAAQLVWLLEPRMLRRLGGEEA